jgi:two-component system OmpR family sensor kinase
VSLRARLTIGLVLLAAIGLALAGGATYGALRSFLFDRVDEQLTEALRRPVIGTRTQVLPAGGFYQVRDQAGAVVREEDGFLFDAAPPDLPREIPLGAITVHADGDGPRYRVAAQRLPNDNLLVLALPLDDVDQTLRRLVVVEAIVAALVLGAIGALGWWLVGIGLRPLEQMGDTADAIAAGDLTRRVEPASERTEVGRLGLALNSMLGQIETAFAERAESEQRLRQFAADASHELRTPLTSIRGYAELFRRGAAQHPEDLAKAMRRIEEEATRMGVLVDDLLLLTRLDQHRPLDVAPVDLLALANDAVDDARAAFPQHAVSVADADSVRIVGDEPRLRQVFANLIANACTHTPPGTDVRVNVARAGTDAVIAVSDDGPGLQPDAAGRVFDQFWRGDGARTRGAGGAGLGLSIVRAIAQAHGGDVELETAPGAGATFRVRIPASVTP